MNTSETNRRRNTYRSHTLLLVLLTLTALLGATAPAVADCECKSPWVINYDEHCVLADDCTVENLIISYGGSLDTSSYTLTITGSTGLIICWGGTLYVSSGGQVVLSGGGTPVVNGRIELRGSGATLRISDNDHTLIGSGKVVGQNNSAQIEIDTGLTLTNEITIEGALEIRAGSGTFVNGAGGLVHANRTSGHQILTLYSGTFDDADGAEWKVSASATAELYFSADITINALDGDFSVQNGTLDLDVSVTTSGHLSFTGGEIQVAPGTTFQAGGSCP